MHAALYCFLAAVSVSRTARNVMGFDRGHGSLICPARASKSCRSLKNKKMNKNVSPVCRRGLPPQVRTHRRKSNKFCRRRLLQPPD
eukprot:9498276-Pyramimonas_sp.AAC.1